MSEMNEITTELWGRMQEHVPDLPDVSADIERSMRDDCLTEVDSDHENDDKVSHLVLDSMDPIMLYTISLHKFATDMTDTILQNGQSHSVLEQSGESPPMIPEPPQVFFKHAMNQLNFMPKNVTAFVDGRDVCQLELSSAAAKRLLMQCTATMFAHVGYESAHNSALTFMTDMLEEFLNTICVAMKTNAEQNRHNVMGQFPHYVEKTLIQAGLGGCKGLHDYYEHRVIKYPTTVHRRCVELQNYSKSREPTTHLSHRVLDSNEYEHDDDEEDVVEVHLDPNAEGTFKYASYAEYELLDTLEEAQVLRI